MARIFSHRYNSVASDAIVPVSPLDPWGYINKGFADETDPCRGGKEWDLVEKEERKNAIGNDACRLPGITFSTHGGADHVRRPGFLRAAGKVKIGERRKKMEISTALVLLAARGVFLFFASMLAFHMEEVLRRRRT